MAKSLTPQENDSGDDGLRMVETLWRPLSPISLSFSPLFVASVSVTLEKVYIRIDKLFIGK